MRANSLAGRVFAVAGLGLCLALPVLAGPAYPIATSTGTDPNQGMKEASAK